MSPKKQERMQFNILFSRYLVYISIAYANLHITIFILYII